MVNPGSGPGVAVTNPTNGFLSNHSTANPKYFSAIAVENGLAYSHDYPLKTGSLSHGHSACITQYFMDNPDRVIRIKDVVDGTGLQNDVVRRELSRLAKSGKGSGPIMRLSQGNYRYDPTKGDGSLADLVQSGRWKTENIRICKHATKGAPPLLSTSILEQTTDHESGVHDTAIAVKKGWTYRQGYPVKLPTGHQITWLHHTSGTEEIWIASNGAPPLSHDALLILLENLEKDGLDPAEEWLCTSIEWNVDSIKQEITNPCTLQVMEGLYYKAYQHGYNARIEIADRRPAPYRELEATLLHLADNHAGITALELGKELDKRVDQIERHLKRPMAGRKFIPKSSPASKAGSRTKENRKKESIPDEVMKEYLRAEFMAGNEIKKERVGV